MKRLTRAPLAAALTLVPAGLLSPPARADISPTTAALTIDAGGSGTEAS